MADGSWRGPGQPAEPGLVACQELNCEHWPLCPLALFAHGRITGGCWPSYQYSPACPATSSHAALNILDRSFLLNFQREEEG